MSIAVELRGVSRYFGDVRAVDRVSLAIEDGEFFSMLGPSGSGKTTCLRLIGGFELPSDGRIFLHGEDASDRPPYERDVNTVFQDYALFPHLSVLDNVAYGLAMKGMGYTARRREATAALEQVALGGLGDRHPGQLSGGQRQRVALARALVNRPRVLLLDEPLGALDLKLREQMQGELKGLQRRLGITFIYVTHDQGEALSMSDRVAVFNHGRVEQVDRPRELYTRPRTTFVAGFVGTANVLIGEVAARILGTAGAVGTVAHAVSIRPEHIAFGAPGPGQLGVSGRVVDVQFHGPTSRFEIDAAGVHLVVTIANRDAGTELGRPGLGDTVELSWSPEAMVELRSSEEANPGAGASAGTVAPGAGLAAAAGAAPGGPIDRATDPRDATRGGVNDPAPPGQRGRESSLSIDKASDPRDATRGGVNDPAPPGQRGRESPLSIDRAPTSESAPHSRRQLGHAVSTFLYRRRRFYLLLLLAPPLLWFGVVFIGALLALVWQSTYTFNDFTMQVTPDLTFANYRALLADTNLDIVIRTVAMAIAVTMACGFIGFPIAYYMARYTRGAARGLFYVGVMLPMWASYIVKAYAWTMILSKGGILYWVVDRIGLRGALDELLTLPVIGGSSLSTSNLGRFLVFSYAWLPFMILPMNAAIERVPSRLIEASADLGARPSQTFRAVLLPLAFPGVVAGSIFTFSLTLGDYIIPQLVGPPGLVIGTMVNLQQGSVGNLPMAAAFTAVPIVIISIYLWIARRLGAFDAL